MAADSDARHRRSIRLQGYDYASEGAYFVTMVTAGRECLFGEIRDESVRLSPIGGAVEEEWLRTAAMRAEVELDAFVVMPNHVHGIIVVAEAPVGAQGLAPLQGPDSSIPSRRPRTLGSLIAGFKAPCTNRINDLRDSPGVPVWQRNYHDRIIRNEAELNRIRQYIINNPANWSLDPENPVTAVESTATTPFPC